MVCTKRPAAVMVGIRADESYNRFLAIASARKQRFSDDKPWTTVAPGWARPVYLPLVRLENRRHLDVVRESKCCYNPLYDLMYKAGVPRVICASAEPFGPEQRQGLWLYHVIEPERWAAMW